MYFDKAQKQYRSSQPLFETNYALLKAFLPDLDGFDMVETSDDAGMTSLAVKVVERFKYTTTVELVLSPLTQLRAFSTCQMKIRLYHDARLAEVVEFQGEGKLAAWYEQYPNNKMFHKDEKRQINRVLSEMLCFCRASGISFEKVYL